MEGMAMKGIGKFLCMIWLWIVCFDAEQHLQRGRFDVKALELHETT
jgi:hypothetical protein